MALRERLNTVWRNRSTPLRMLRHSHVNFSQYAEDIIFERLMQPNRHGTYVDVGAHHPFKGSNTYRLHVHGWSGLTIDPNPKFVPLFKKTRPNDIHLAEGVSLEKGHLTYYQFENDVMNSFSSDRAESLLKTGEILVATSEIPCRPLGMIVDEHIPGRQIDLLSVDCEGLDIEVLQSLDLRKRRPTVLIVEDYATFGSFQEDLRPGELQTFLHDAGYRRIAQAGWSTILVADNWRDLFERSGAYSAERMSNGYLPGQAFGNRQAA